MLTAVPMRRPVGAARLRSESEGGWAGPTGPATAAAVTTSRVAVPARPTMARRRSFTFLAPPRGGGGCRRIPKVSDIFRLALTVDGRGTDVNISAFIATPYVESSTWTMVHRPGWLGPGFEKFRRTC